MLFNMFVPFLPPNCDKPPTVYSVLNAIVNGDKEDEDDYTKIKDLAKEGRNVIFSFDYPLSSKVDKEYFETMILNHYMTRRIGFETVTNFKLHLQVKLNTIMPKYNLLFDNIADVFKTRVITKEGSDNSNTTTSTESTNSSTSNSTTDNRFSDEPQSEIQDVKAGKYVSNYSYIQGDVTSSGNATNQGNGSNARNYNEIITEEDKDDNYFKVQNEMINVFEMIFKDLDSLFFSVV